MSVDLKKTVPDNHQKMAVSLSQEQQAKISEVRRLVGSLSDKASVYCTDASISRYLRSQNWNVKKATQMLKLSLKWREEYKPEEIRWDGVSAEAETGKIYRPNYCDKHGRSVLVMKPSRQNTKSVKEQMRNFVYCMENAILNLPPNQEEVVWLVDFNGFNLSNLSFKVATETAHVIQKYYPQRLGLAIMYDAPKIFQPFFNMVKVVLEPETFNKVKFVYSKDQDTKKIMEDLFDMDQLESAFGGNDATEFDMNKYAKRMREEDNKTHSFWTQTNSVSSLDSTSLAAAAASETSKHEKIHHVPNPDQCILINQGGRNATALE